MPRGGHAVNVQLTSHPRTLTSGHMCGIAGFWTSKLAPPEEAERDLRAMGDAIASRGPDDQGRWYHRGVGLAHRRLSILDLSPLGHQPMRSASERYIISYNGEVFNFAEIRKELEASAPGTLRGGSDTEVILAAVEAWGLSRAVERFVGMFAFALWDQQRNVLHLVRDRLGIKPLYWGRTGDGIAFGSQLSAMRALPTFDDAVDPSSVALFMRYRYVPSPRSIYARAWKVEPGSILTFSDPASEPMATKYWSAAEHVARGIASPFAGSDVEALERVHVLLRDAVRLRLVSDVPVGAFLSGGIDSSAVVALMQSVSTARVRTFCIGSEARSHDESTAARAVAHHLGTDHSELMVSANDALAVIPSLPAIYDEPFADPSQIPTYLVSRLARAHVTVSLSGDGGDEVFGGYNRHVAGGRVWHALRLLPTPARARLRSALKRIPRRLWGDIADAIGGRLPPRFGVRTAGDKLEKFLNVASAVSSDDLYERLSCAWLPDEHPTTGWAPPRELESIEGLSSVAQAMMYRDLVTYLPDDILVKVDRASMAVGLEARVPLLDHRVVEFAWSLPMHLKVRGGVGKWILREVLAKYVPRPLWDRPKTGFGVPIATWLRGALRPWAEDLLSESSLRTDGNLDVGVVRHTWKDHVNGVRNAEDQLWTVLMFVAWRRRSRPA